ncbi:MAG: hypothetical protein HC788_01885 [Sphingopyxis sp.]|nr:hypothetical protein [Sphingopyxis sp.]
MTKADLTPGEMLDKVHRMVISDAFAERGWFGDEESVEVFPDILQIEQLTKMPTPRCREANALFGHTKSFIQKSTYSALCKGAPCKCKD